MRLRNTVALLTLMVTAACAGARARDDGLLPFMRDAWANLRGDVAAGIAAERLVGRMSAQSGDSLLVAGGEMTAALASAEPARIAAVPWPALRQVAELGIAAKVADGRIGPDVAPSLRRRVTEFDRALTTYLGR